MRDEVASGAEALTNAAVGLVVSWAVTFWALPMWGLEPSATDAAWITGLYFAVSFARSFIIREAFRRGRGY